MDNFFAAGFAAFQLLLQHPNINVPIYAHCGGREALGRAAGQGISASVFVKMVRFLGGDYFCAGMYASYLFDTDEDFRTLHQAANETWCPIEPILISVSGGLNPKIIGVNVSRLSRYKCFFPEPASYPTLMAPEPGWKRCAWPVRMELKGSRCCGLDHRVFSIVFGADCFDCFRGYVLERVSHLERTPRLCDRALRRCS